MKKEYRKQKNVEYPISNVEVKYKVEKVIELIGLIEGNTVLSF